MTCDVEKLEIDINRQSICPSHAKIFVELYYKYLHLSEFIHVLIQSSYRCMRTFQACIHRLWWLWDFPRQHPVRIPIIPLVMRKVFPRFKPIVQGSGASHSLSRYLHSFKPSKTSSNVFPACHIAQSSIL